MTANNSNMPSSAQRAEWGRKGGLAGSSEDKRKAAQAAALVRWGKDQVAIEARALGLDPAVIRRRISRGMTREQALSTPVIQRQPSKPRRPGGYRKPNLDINSSGTTQHHF